VVSGEFCTAPRALDRRQKTIVCLTRIALDRAAVFIPAVSRGRTPTAHQWQTTKNDRLLRAKQGRAHLLPEQLPGFRYQE
jgi:hypothetical protein